MANYYGWSSGSELYHYGIPGQKWGQRRFQNPDGSLTAEGRARYGRIAERHYAAGRALNKYASAHKGSKLGNLAAKAGKRQVQIGNSYKNSKSQNARDKKVQKALKIGAAVAGTALAAYGGYKLAQGIQRKKYGVPLTGMTKAARNRIKAESVTDAQKRANRLNNTLTRSRIFSGRATAGDKVQLAKWKTKAGINNAKVGMNKLGRTIKGKAKVAGAKISGSAKVGVAKAKLAGANANLYLRTGGLKRTASSVGKSIGSGARKVGYGVLGGATKAGRGLSNVYGKVRNAGRNVGYAARGVGVVASNKIRRRKK